MVSLSLSLVYFTVPVYKYKLYFYFDTVVTKEYKFFVVTLFGYVYFILSTLPMDILLPSLSTSSVSTYDLKNLYETLVRL